MQRVRPGETTNLFPTGCKGFWNRPNILTLDKPSGRDETRRPVLAVSTDNQELVRPPRPRWRNLILQSGETSKIFAMSARLRHWLQGHPHQSSCCCAYLRDNPKGTTKGLPPPPGHWRCETSQGPLQSPRTYPVRRSASQTREISIARTHS